MKFAILVAASLITMSAASAHEVQKGPNGGMVVDVAGHHVELVSSGTDLVLFLTDEKDVPVASAGTKNARAIVQDSGKTTSVTLEPVAPNKLSGRLAQPMQQGARVVVSATLADGHAIQARFVKN